MSLYLSHLSHLAGVLIRAHPSQEGKENARHERRIKRAAKKACMRQEQPGIGSRLATKGTREGLAAIWLRLQTST